MGNVTLIEEFDLSVTPLGTSGLAVTGIDAYDEITVVCTDMVTTVTNQPVFVRLSNDGGSSYRSGASDYARAFMRGNSSYSYGAAAAADALPVVDEDNNTSGSWGRFSIYAPGESDAKTLVASHMSSEEYHWTMSGQVNTAEVNDALLIYANSGNFTTGRIRVYGVTYSTFATLLNRDFSTSNLDAAGPHIEIADLDLYDEIWIRASGIVASNSGANLKLRLSNDGGSTFDSGASDYYVSQHSNTQTEAAADHMRCYGYGDNYGHSVCKLLLHKTSAAKTMMEQHGAGDTNPLLSFSTKETAEVNDALQIISGAGNITAGRLFVYGVTY